MPTDPFDFTSEKDWSDLLKPDPGEEDCGRAKEEFRLAHKQYASPWGDCYWVINNEPVEPCASLADGQAQAEACWQARLAGVLEEQR